MTALGEFTALAAQRDLTRAEAGAAAQLLLGGGNSDEAIAALLTALAHKGETGEELIGFAQVMRALAPDLNIASAPELPELIDTCGTGGAPRTIFNVSTAAALVAAGAGARVAKHGNRTSTSRCGSADVLEALGLNLDFPTGRLGACLADCGIVFLYAPLLHTAVRAVMPARRALKSHTIFNLLGPLTSPARARAQIVGVYSASVIGKMAAALLALGTRHAFVVHSEDGLCEFATTAPTQVAEVKDGAIRHFTLDARQLGLAPATLADLAGGGPAENAALLRGVLAGEPGPRRDIVALNAAAALVAGGYAADFAAGLVAARAAIDSGAAAHRLATLVAFTAAHRTQASHACS